MERFQSVHQKVSTVAMELLGGGLSMSGTRTASDLKTSPAKARKYQSLSKRYERVQRQRIKAMRELQEASEAFEEAAKVLRETQPLESGGIPLSAQGSFSDGLFHVTDK